MQILDKISNIKTILKINNKNTQQRKQIHFYFNFYLLFKNEIIFTTGCNHFRKLKLHKMNKNNFL